MTQDTEASEEFYARSGIGRLQDALHLEIKKLSKQLSGILGVPESELDYTQYMGRETPQQAFQNLLVLRATVLNLEQMILDTRKNSLLPAQLNADLSTDVCLQFAAHIAADHGFNGYIEKHAVEYADRSVNYNVYQDTEYEDGTLIARNVLWANLPYERAYELGRKHAELCGLKDTLKHGMWITVMPCEIETLVRVEPA